RRRRGFHCARRGGRRARSGRRRHRHGYQGTGRQNPRAGRYPRGWTERGARLQTPSTARRSPSPARGERTVIRVLLAEDQLMLRTAVRRLLELEEDIEVVAEVARGDELVAAALAAQPDVAVVDIEMPAQDG